jgi:hypothetical protein
MCSECCSMSRGLFVFEREALIKRVLGLRIARFERFHFG